MDVRVRPETGIGPLSIPLFRALWVATIVSNVGIWMSNVGAGWLIASISPVPFVVALVQVATTLPMFLLALPAGALADIVDRRRMLIASQILSLVSAACLAFATWVGIMDVWVLLGFSALMAAGAALSAPAFQAIVPELVSKDGLQDAITLNGLGINVARAIGPALAGIIISAAGPEMVFALNSLTTLGVVYVLARWRRPSSESILPVERLAGAMRAGLRYALRAPELQSVLVRSVAFFLFASCIWALLPLIAKDMLKLGPEGYGGLLGFMGVGAVFGAVVLKQIRRRMPSNLLSIGASLVLAAGIGGLALAENFVIAAALLLLIGLGWIMMMSVLNGAAQAWSPGWVKARALAIYLLVFQGAMTLGSLIWGALGGLVGIPLTLLISAAGLVLFTALVARRHPLEASTSIDLTPSLHWPSPILAVEPEMDRGPVMVIVEYRIRPEDIAGFVAAMRDMKKMRRRDGAIGWGLYEDAAEPGLMIEWFTVESWLEHLRQHARVTNADRINQEAIHRFHLGEQGPHVRHFIAP